MRASKLTIACSIAECGKLGSRGFRCRDVRKVGLSNIRVLHGSHRKKTSTLESDVKLKYTEHTQTHSLMVKYARLRKVWIPPRNEHIGKGIQPGAWSCHLRTVCRAASLRVGAVRRQTVAIAIRCMGNGRARNVRAACRGATTRRRQRAGAAVMVCRVGGNWRRDGA